MIEKLKKLLKKAVERCYHDDKFLIEQKMERASVARILIYMQELINADIEFVDFRKYNLDSEYNRLGSNSPKSINGQDTSYPDLILHKRKTKKNILVVEFKCQDNNDINNDINKLTQYTGNDLTYKYKLGVFVKLNIAGAKYTFFKHGTIIEDENNILNG